MEFGAATATLPKKLSSGYSGRSAYDGVFAAPVKLRAPSFSSRFDDYREIFGSSGGNASGVGGGGGASLGSSIPILELPELNDERSKIDEVRRSKLDYSAVFGGFRNLDGAVRFEELAAAEPKKKKQSSFVNGASTRSKANGGDQSCSGDPSSYSKETPVVSQSSNVGQRINMSYHRVNQGGENGTNGTTHIAQVHAVPAYTCLVEEVNPVKMNRTNKSVPAAPAAQEACSSNHYTEGIKEVERRAGASPDNAKKQSSNSGVKVNNRSDSVDLFFDACETSNGTHHIKVPPLETVVGDTDICNGNGMRSTATKCQASSKSDTSQGAARADSPSYSDDMVDSNSEAAASVAALRKAIEEAQLRLKVAKESLRRKKEGFPDRVKVKRKSNIDLKADVKKEPEVSHKTTKLEEIKMRQTFGETDALPQVSSEVGRPIMKEHVRANDRAEEMFIAREAMQDAQEKFPSTDTEHKEEGEHKKEDHSKKFLELKDAEINKKLMYKENTGCSAEEKPEESGFATEVIEVYWEQQKVRVVNEADACEELANETCHWCQEKISAGNEANTCEELDETEHRSQEVLYETKLVQVTPDNRMMGERLKVNKDDGAVKKVTPLHEPEDRESNLCGKGLITREKQVSYISEYDGKKVEGAHAPEESERNLNAIEELSKMEENIDQEQKVIEENVEVSSDPEECELTEFLDPVDNEIACSPHGSDLEEEMQNLECLEDRMKMGEAGFLDENLETAHSFQREGIENTFTNVYVQEIPEEIVDHTHDEEEVYKRSTKDTELDENERVQDAKANENELERGFCLMEENERGSEDNKEPVEVIGVAQIDPNYEEIEAEEAVKPTETSSNYEHDESEKLVEIQLAETVIEDEEALKVNPEVYSHDVQDDISVASDASFEHQDKYGEPESAHDTNFCEKHAAETSDSIQETSELNDAVNKMQSTSSTVTSDGDDASIGETEIKVRQEEDQCLGNTNNDCNLAAHVEETTAEPVETCNDAMEGSVASNEEIDENQSISSKDENLFENEHNVEACQIPSTSEWKSSLFKEVDVKTIQSSLKENQQASATMEEKEANANSQKLELEKEHLKKVDEAKEKERERRREREKEKLAVERAIREARERAFADARERAALERAAAEARQKNIDGRERLGKSSGQANEKTLAEKAAMEVKLKAERAAVERATAEARARALERALSEKAASEARYKSDKPDQPFGASRNNGIRPNFHSKSFSYGVRDIDVFDGANGDSAQRCKARSERHQRIGERVAKALAEKNMRDRLVQKEQEERNRIAEALDADVKRWSTGKAGNLRALLSTLQYILGPDSGWQPIPLTEIVTTAAVKKAYRKATLFVHPDKLQQRGASIQQKYICEKVFDLLKEAWNRFNMEER